MIHGVAVRFTCAACLRRASVHIGATRKQEMGRHTIERTVRKRGTTCCMLALHLKCSATLLWKRVVCASVTQH